MWAGVRYVDLYPGVDLVLGAQSLDVSQSSATSQTSELSLPWRLEAGPGADLAAVRLRVEGAEELSLDESGNALRVQTAVGELEIPLIRVSGDAGDAARVEGAMCYHR